MTTMATNLSFLHVFDVDTLLPLLLDFLDETSLSILPCCCLDLSSASCQLDVTWKRLAKKRCRQMASRGSGDGTKASFPVSADEAKEFLQLRWKRLNAETLPCHRLTCGKVGTARCSKCKVVMYCGRECQRQDWNCHKSCCKQMNAIGLKAIKLMNSEHIVLDPWFSHIGDFVEQEQIEDAGVWAEYDPETFQLRGFGSTLNMKQTTHEKRFHNNGIFHSVVSVNHCIQYGAEESPIFQKALDETCAPLLRWSRVDGSSDSALLILARAVEGALAKLEDSGVRQF